MYIANKEGSSNCRRFAAVIVISVLIMILGFLWYVNPSSRPVATRLVCRNKLVQLGIALRQYHEDYHCYPPAYVPDEKGRPMYSWRVLLLPYLDYENVYIQYDFSEPWDGPNNRNLAAKVKFYNCPAEQENAAQMTNYLAIVGPTTAWPAPDASRRNDMSDGPENTILLVEVADTGIHWMEPRDLHIIQMNPSINPSIGHGVSSIHGGGANVLFAGDPLISSNEKRNVDYGRVWFLPDDLTSETLISLLTIAGGEDLEVRPSEIAYTPLIVKK